MSASVTTFHRIGVSFMRPAEDTLTPRVFHPVFSGRKKTLKRRMLFVTCIAALFAVGSLAFGSGKRATNDGPLANATVSFGAWGMPVDRFPNLNPRPANHHALIPNEVTIHCGGSVNFIIAGLHLVLVYDDGTKPGDINTNLLISPTNQPLPPLIADPNGRIYRGLDPSTVPQDRVEVVQFKEPGRYLVACGVLPHFREGMYGYVRVLPCGPNHDH